MLHEFLEKTTIPSFQSFRNDPFGITGVDIGYFRL